MQHVSTNQRGLRLSHETTTGCLLFPETFSKPVVACFDQRQGSSDGGAVLLKVADRRLGLTEALAQAQKLPFASTAYGHFYLLPWGS